MKKALTIAGTDSSAAPEGIGVDAVTTGMLPNVETIELAARKTGPSRERTVHGIPFCLPGPPSGTDHDGEVRHGARPFGDSCDIVHIKPFHPLPCSDGSLWQHPPALVDEL